MDLWIRIIILVVLSYSLGNWSMARMIAWNARRVDISQQGSGNPGTMNMIRSFGYKRGIATLILDVIKGAVPAALGGFFLEMGMHPEAGFYYSQLGIYIGGISVIAGQMFPVVFKFKGGKGVACCIGVFLAADPLMMLAIFAVAFVVFVVFEYGFIASLTCVVGMAIIEYIMLFTGNPIMNNTTQHTAAVAVLIGVITLMILIAHRPNFVRLFKGTEAKLSMRDAIRKSKQKKREGKPAQDPGAGAPEVSVTYEEKPGGGGCGIQGVGNGAVASGATQGAGKKEDTIAE